CHVVCPSSPLCARACPWCAAPSHYYRRRPKQKDAAALHKPEAQESVRTYGDARTDPVACDRACISEQLGNWRRLGQFGQLAGDGRGEGPLGDGGPGGEE